MGTFSIGNPTRAQIVALEHKQITRRNTTSLKTCDAAIAPLFSCFAKITFVKGLNILHLLQMDSYVARRVYFFIMSSRSQERRESTTEPNTPEPAPISANNEGLPGRDFARMNPISRSARIALTTLSDAISLHPQHEGRQFPNSVLM